MNLDLIAKFYILERCLIEPCEWPSLTTNTEDGCHIEELKPLLEAALEKLIVNNEVKVTFHDHDGSATRIVALTEKGGAEWERFARPDWQRFSRSIERESIHVWTYNYEALKAATYYYVRSCTMSPTFASSAVLTLDKVECQKQIKPLRWRSRSIGFHARLFLDRFKYYQKEDIESFTTFVNWKAETRMSLRWYQFGFTCDAQELLTDGWNIDRIAVTSWIEQISSRAC